MVNYGLQLRHANISVKVSLTPIATLDI